MTETTHLNKDGTPDRRFGPKPDRKMNAAMQAQMGKGRTKGTKNKMTAELKQMIERALERQKGGGVGYLSRQAKENPVAFMGLLGKILPKQIDVGVSVQAVDLMGTMQQRRTEVAAMRIKEALDVEFEDD